MVDDPAFFPELARHVAITVTTELLDQRLLNIIDHYLIFKELSICIHAMSTGFYSSWQAGQDLFYDTAALAT